MLATPALLCTQKLCSAGFTGHFTGSCRIIGLQFPNDGADNQRNTGADMPLPFGGVPRVCCCLPLSRINCPTVLSYSSLACCVFWRVHVCMYLCMSLRDDRVCLSKWFVGVSVSDLFLVKRLYFVPAQKACYSPTTRMHFHNRSCSLIW